MEKVSIIIPCHNEELNLKQLILELIEETKKISQYQFEIIVVDDNSKDNTWNIILELKKIFHQLFGIRLFVQTGQTAALSAGIDQSSGEIIILMDGDGQNPPSELGLLLSRMEEGIGVVSGWRKNRKDSLLFKKIPSWIANKLIQKITGIWVKDLGCSFKAYRREFITSFKLYGDMHRFLAIYAVWEGATLINVPVSHKKRKYGTSHYGLSRTIKILVDIALLTFFNRFRTRPLHYFGYLGSFVFLIGSLFAIGLVFLIYSYYHLSLAILLMLSAVNLGIIVILLIGFGILGELLLRTYYESQNKTIYRIKDQI